MSLAPNRTTLRTLHGGRLAVVATVLAVALAVDAADPMSGRRAALLGVGFTTLLLTLVYEVVARRGFPLRALLMTEMAGDVALSTWAVSLTGGAGGQFVLLLPLVAFVGGMLLGLRGGAGLGGLTAAAFVFLLAASPAGSVGPGAGRTVQMVFYPIFFVAVGSLSGLLGNQMAAREKALADAAEEMEKLRLDTQSIVQNLSSGLLTIDRSGRVVHFNHVAEVLLGCRAREARGRRLAEALGPAHRELVDKVEATLTEGIPLLRAEVRMTGDDGAATPIGVSTSVLSDGTGRKTGVVALFQDLSEVRRLEEASRRQDRLSVIGGMAASIAHEVRNCVNPISGSVEILQQELELSGENAKLLELIGREAARMERFVSELLNFTRGNPIHLKEVTLEAVLDDTLDKISRHPSFRATVSLRRNYGPGPTRVMADPSQLEQVFFNLALNAIEAMGPVGSLTVSLEPPRGDNGECVVEMADTGTGMSRETLDRIFEPFYSTKGSGAGLGLAIAHRIVERHRGRMEVTSRPGSGTRVRVCLPGAGVDAAEAEHLASVA